MSTPISVFQVKCLTFRTCALLLLLYHYTIILWRKFMQISGSDYFVTPVSADSWFRSFCDVRYYGEEFPFILWRQYLRCPRGVIEYRPFQLNVIRVISIVFLTCSKRFYEYRDIYVLASNKGEVVRGSPTFQRQAFTLPTTRSCRRVRNDEIFLFNQWL